MSCICPLCSSKNIVLFFEDRKRVYLRCFYCKLVFVPNCYWLSAEDEKQNYDLHENNAADHEYRRFLSRLTTPLLKRLNLKQKGLDFGSGQNSPLPVILEKYGHQMDIYDPFYYKNPLVFYKKYDFICATEVVEHLHNPNKEFTLLFKMLKPGAWLGIMTKLVIDKEQFSKWHYIRDMTHVCFYSSSTFKYLARRFKTKINFIGNDVILLNKK